MYSSLHNSILDLLLELDQTVDDVKEGSLDRGPLETQLLLSLRCVELEDSGFVVDVLSRLTAGDTSSKVFPLVVKDVTELLVAVVATAEKEAAIKTTSDSLVVGASDIAGVGVSGEAGVRDLLGVKEAVDGSGGSVEAVKRRDLLEGRTKDH